MNSTADIDSKGIKPDRISINPNLDNNQLPGRLAHEGVHVLLRRRVLSVERAAHDAAFSVDQEIGVSGARNRTDTELRRDYVDVFPYLEDDL